MARPENRSEARALSPTLPIETFNYLALLATLGKLGRTENEVATHILVREVYVMHAQRFHETRIPAPEGEGVATFDLLRSWPAPAPRHGPPRRFCARDTVLPGQDTRLPQLPAQVTVLSEGAVRLDRRGREHRHVDSMRLELLMQRQGQTPHVRLSAGFIRHEGSPLVRAHGAHEHQPARAAPHEPFAEVA